jgi:glycosyltransferase involved in cell wall biosynthesis
MSAPLANILILNTQVPFTRGGAEVLCDKLSNALRQANYRVDTVSLPFSALPKPRILKHMAEWKTLDLDEFAGHKVDMVIATKFPSYLVNHKNKVVWLVHQHRQAYELYNTRFGDFDATPEDEILRATILKADEEAFATCKKIYTISPNVTERLQRYIGQDSEPLLPPLPLGGQYYSAEPEPYLLYVGRICSIKRVDLIVRALPQINEKLKLKIVGVADEPNIEAFLQSEINKHHLGHRVEFLGRVSDQELLDVYAKSFAVFYAPYDEDYGIVTLEALESAKPVITAKDSGCVLHFIRDRENGLVVDPNEAEIAKAVNELFEQPALYQQLVSTAAKSKFDLSWSGVAQQFINCLS